jgi:hypothetical protein
MKCGPSVCIGKRGVLHSKSLYIGQFAFFHFPKLMKIPMKRFRSFAMQVVGLCLALNHCPMGYPQGDEGAETKFIAMLKNATLKGTWAPVQQGKLGSEKGDDSYRIARVEKGDFAIRTWSFRFQPR